jgi:hypothetical protein
LFVKKDTFISCAMAGGKHAPEEKCKPSPKHTATEFETKIPVIHKYECEQSMSAIACEPGFVVSTLNTTMKDIAHIKEHVNFTFHVGMCVFQYSILLLVYFGSCVCDIRYDEWWGRGEN